MTVYIYNIYITIYIIYLNHPKSLYYKPSSPDSETDKHNSCPSLPFLALPTVSTIPDRPQTEPCRVFPWRFAVRWSWPLPTVPPNAWGHWW